MLPNFVVYKFCRRAEKSSLLQVFDFKSLTWSSIKLKMEPVTSNGSKENLLAASSHIMVKKNCVFVIPIHLIFSHYCSFLRY